MKLRRVDEVPLAPRGASDRVAEAAGKLALQVRERSDRSLSLWQPSRISQLRRGVTIAVSLEEPEAGRTRVTMSCGTWRWRLLRRQILESRLSELAAAVGRRGPAEEAVPPQIERWLIRSLMAALAIVALLCALLIAVPQKPASTTSTPAATAAKVNDGPPEGNSEDDLPSIALDQVGLYRTEVGLAVFYIGLLVLVPLFYGVIRGRMPSEISARGTRFAADEISGSLDAAERKIERVDQRLLAAEGLIALTRAEQVPRRTLIERLHLPGRGSRSQKAEDGLAGKSGTTE